MKKTIFTLLILLCAALSYSQTYVPFNYSPKFIGSEIVTGRLAVGQTISAETSAVAEFESTTQGFLIPRMTEAQRDAISSPATGLQIYNSDTDEFNYYDGIDWVASIASVGTEGEVQYSDGAGGFSSSPYFKFSTIDKIFYAIQPSTPPESGYGNTFSINDTTRINIHHIPAELDTSIEVTIGLSGSTARTGFEIRNGINGEGFTFPSTAPIAGEVLAATSGDGNGVSQLGWQQLPNEVAWGDTITGSSAHSNEVLYFSPTGQLISDGDFIRDSASLTFAIYATAPNTSSMAGLQADTTALDLTWQSIAGDTTIVLRFGSREGFDAGVCIETSTPASLNVRYYLPLDTGSVGQVLGVVANDGIGNATLGWGDFRPYEVYTALITQASTDAPTVKILQNTLQNDITWSYTNVGEYTGTLASAFTDNKTYATLTQGNSTGGILQIFRATENTVIIHTVDIGLSSVNGYLTDASLEIRVYH